MDSFVRARRPVRGSITRWGSLPPYPPSLPPDPLADIAGFNRPEGESIQVVETLRFSPTSKFHAMFLAIKLKR